MPRPSTVAVATETETGLDVPSQPIPSVVPEMFIPVDRDDIVHRVLSKLFQDEDREEAAAVIKLMSALRQVETGRTLDELVKAFDAFNPDDETVNEKALSPPERRLQLDGLKAKVVDLVVSANYIEITPEKLKGILTRQSDGGFAANVDLNEYDFHLLYYRGAIKDHHPVRSWRTLWVKAVPKEVDAYRRLFLGLKLKPRDVRVSEFVAGRMPRKKAERRVNRLRNGQMLEGVSDHTLHLKLFRRIAQHELRILFPNAKIRFTLFDRLWLWVGSGGSTVFAMGAAALKFFFAVLISPIFFILTVGGALAAVIRSVTNFFNTRTRYMAKLAKSLYFHNLASNQSVLALLADDAEEEDIKEAVLTYACLLKARDTEQENVKFAVERFLKDEFDVDCAFDFADGLGHLRGFGLLPSTEGGHVQVLNLPDAHAELLKRWHGLAV